MAVTESVKIVFEVDDKALVSTVQQLQAIGKVSQEDAAKFNALSQASKAAGASLDGASKGAKQFADATKEVAKSAEQIKTVGTSLTTAGQSAKTASDGFVSLRTRLKEATLELQRLEDEFGPFSQEAVNARNKAGELADQFDDLQRQIRLTNPEGKVQAFQKLGQGIVGAFSVATGALQAFGAENEQVQQIAQKLQGALNIAQGIQSIVGLKEAYDDVKTVLGFTTAAQNTLTTATTAGAAATTGAATATRGFAAALTSTGIGAIVVALGALVGAYLLYSNSTKEAKADEEALKAAQDASKTSTDNLKAATDKLAVARGQKTQAQVDKENELEASLKRQEDLNKVLGNAISEQLNAQAEVNKLSAGAAPSIRKEREERLEAAKAAVAQAAAAIQAEKDGLKATNAYIDLTQQQQSAADAAAKADKDANERKQRRIQLIDDEIAALEEAQRGALIGVNDEFQRLSITDSFRENITAKQIERAKVAGESITLIEQKAANDQKQSFEDLVKANDAQRDKDVESAKQAAKDKVDAERQAIEQTLALNKLDNLIVYQQKSIELNKQLNKQKGESDEEYAKRKEQILRNLDKLERELRIANLKSEVAAQDKKLEKLKESGKEGTEEYKKAAKEKEVTSNELTQAEIDNANKSSEAQTKTSKKTVEINANVLNQYIEQTQAAFDLVADIQRERLDRELSDLEQQREKGVITEEQYQEKVAQIKRKQAAADKNAAIFQATLQFSQALINALTTTPATAAPAALILAAAVAGANLAKIIATPLPKFKKGTLAVPGTDTGDDSVMAMLRPGEAVIPTEINREYASAIKAIYTRKVSSKELNDFVNSRMSVVRDEPVLNFNPVTLDALYKRDLRISNMSGAVSRASGGSQSINIKANVDTYALGKVIGKNKSMEVTNVESIGEAVAEALSRRTNRRQQI